MHENIGKLGIWANIYGDSYPDQIRLGQQIERWGYSALWIPDPLQFDPFITLAALAPHTSELYLATGIANIQTRSPSVMAALRRSLGMLCNGRLILGLGVSHREMVTGMLGMDYSKPLTTMASYLDEMKKTPGAQGGNGEQYGLVVLAALRDKMLALAGRKTDGAHPYLVTPEHTAHARQVLEPNSFLAPEQKILFIKDATTARHVARKHLAMYFGLQNYCDNLMMMGFAREDFEHGGSDRLIDSLVAWGDESQIMARLEEHWRQGADHVCIQPLRPDGEPGYDYRAIEALAPGG